MRQVWIRSGSAGRCGASSPGGKLTSACYAGANLVPVGATPAAVTAFAGRARLQGRRCSSIVGPAEAVGPDVGTAAPLLGAAPGDPGSPAGHGDLRAAQAVPDPQLRRVRPTELDVLLPASVAMFTEEVGVSPLGTGRRGGLPGPGGRADRARAGVRPDRGRPGDVQGRDRGRHPARLPGPGRMGAPRAAGPGLAAAGMAAVVTEALQTIAPVVSLYVNDFKHGPRGLPQSGVHRGGHADLGPVLSGPAGCCSGAGLRCCSERAQLRAWPGGTGDRACGEAGRQDCRGEAGARATSGRRAREGTDLPDGGPPPGPPVASRP